ncbi:9931_t:CDS:1 [Dentiscutata heterogama]|uniref:9931_t:CDS:1 n=1 Tax=Dentiscutata heterogama TaxID=1316150 RepID=A0ACA9NVM9_9GLOM|nr:9931_t:CDS:1 [Dentiscutata heterogama]
MSYPRKSILSRFNQSKHEEFCDKYSWMYDKDKRISAVIKILNKLSKDTTCFYKFSKVFGTQLQPQFLNESTRKMYELGLNVLEDNDNIPTSDKCNPEEYNYYMTCKKDLECLTKEQIKHRDNIRNQEYDEIIERSTNDQGLKLEKFYSEKVPELSDYVFDRIIKAKDVEEVLDIQREYEFFYENILKTYFSDSSYNNNRRDIGIYDGHEEAKSIFEGYNFDDYSDKLDLAIRKINSIRGRIISTYKTFYLKYVYDTGIEKNVPYRKEDANNFFNEHAKKLEIFHHLSPFSFWILMLGYY